jgi:16S rRNA (cytosine1402-N4)-methyltransferase
MTSAHQLALPGLAEAVIEWVFYESTDEEIGVRTFAHTTVMKDEVIAALAPRPGGLYVDVTLGGGGHAEAICEAADVRLVGFDRDARALEAARERLARFGDRVTVAQ